MCIAVEAGSLQGLLNYQRHTEYVRSALARTGGLNVIHKPMTINYVFTLNQRDTNNSFEKDMNATIDEAQGPPQRLTAPAEEIVGKELIAYDIASDGNRFRLCFSCANGKRCSVSLPTECLMGLIMTLPRMMTQALWARFGDDRLRLVYPAEKAFVEGSPDPNTFIMTLTTPDGFTVSFSLSRQQLDALTVNR
jgi:hypothetical protein